MGSFNFVSFLWSDPNAKHVGNFSYGFDHVNKLFRQASKGFIENGITDYYLTIVTDKVDLTGLDLSIPNLRVIPMWSDFRDLGRCFTKLKMFSKIHNDPITGEDIHRSVLFPGDYLIVIDLDIVVTKPKDFIKALTSNKLEGFKGYRDSKNPRCYSGALWRIDTRTHGEWHFVYDTFRHYYDLSKGIGASEKVYSNWNRVSSFVGSDQSWISTAVGEGSYPNKWSYENGGIIDYWQIQELPSLPLKTCAVFLNGMRRDSSMPEFQEKHEWIREHWVNV